MTYNRNRRNETPPSSSATLNWFETGGRGLSGREARAFVALVEPLLPLTTGVFAALESRGFASAGPPAHGSDSTTCVLNGATLTWKLVREPAPLRRLACGCSPEIELPSMARQRAHVAITGTAEDMAPADIALATTYAAAALARSPAACGVYWGASKVLLAPERFIRFADRGTREVLPVFLWVRMQIEMTRSGLSVFTDGLEEFGRPEVEVRHSKRSIDEVMRRVESLVDYVIRTNAEIHPGHSFGIDDGEALPIRHARSQFFEDRRIVCVLGI